MQRLQKEEECRRAKDDEPCVIPDMTVEEN